MRLVDERPAAPNFGTARAVLSVIRSESGSRTATSPALSVAPSRTTTPRPELLPTQKICNEGASQPPAPSSHAANDTSGASAAQLGASHGSEGDDIAASWRRRERWRERSKCCRFCIFRPRSLRPPTGAMEP